MRRFVWVLALLTASCTGALKGGTIGDGSSHVDPTPHHAVGLTVRDAAGPIAGAWCWLDGRGTPEAVQSDAHGTVIFTYVVKSLRATQLRCHADGYLNFSEHRDLTGKDPEPALVALMVKVPPPHVDPSNVPLRELARIRGAMWSARYPMPWGPRPNAADNILALPAIANYPEAAKRIAMLRAYRAEGYTHGVIGAWRPGPYSPYHDVYPEVDISFDAYLDLLQEFWDEGVEPVVFVKPDNWSCSQLETLTPYYSQPRAQRLVRIAVPGGWEPSKDTSNAEWVCWVQWGARVLPNAVRAIHLEADFDAPGNNADFTDVEHGGDPAKYIGMPEAWRRVAPYLHLYLIQNGGYVFGGYEQPTAQFLKNFTDQFRLNGRPGRGSMADRFTWGYAGWPTSSAWGPGVGICPVAAEYAAYADFWLNYPERFAQQLGDLAIEAGACGYLDGGTVTVPAQR